MLKSSLRDNPYVQAPILQSVKTLLNNISLTQSYYPRGSNRATSQLKSLLKNHREWVKPIIDIKGFRHGYITAGATEGINLWRLSDQRPWQYITGDYQWPQMVSNDGIETDINNLDPDRVLYISNPSCIDGNYLSQEYIDKINEAGCPVIYDCTYVSSSCKHDLVVPEHTEQIMFSFSKGFGLIGQRCGLLYTKKIHKILEPLKTVECYNYLSINIINELINNFYVTQMYDDYKEEQTLLCDKHSLTLSDVYFIANSTDPYYEKRRRSGDTARLCLTDENTNDK